MSAPASLRRHAPVTLGLAARVEAALLWIAGAALLALALLAIVKPSLFDLPSLVDTDDGPRLLAAVAVYALCHVFRFLRLALLVHRPSVRMRRVLGVHLFTAGLAVFLPFKLSDLVRIREVGVVTGQFRTGLLAVWLERTMDAAVLLVFVIVAAIGVPDSLGQLTPFLVVMGAFVTVTLVLITVVPDNIRELMLHVVRRPFGERSVSALRLLRAALQLLHEAPTLVRGRLPTLLLLSVLIWGLELAVVAIAIPGVGTGLSEVAAAMLALLSGLSAGTTPLMPGTSDRLVEVLTDFGVTADVGLYRACLVVPPLLAGAWGALTYLPWRARRQRAMEARA